ncbi:TonB-dependent siderophore receptor [Gloeocapsa sp. PCC 73106]|uniref:TonB-dependent siderophore receptor n=1 Tax=Gloeocapsa sp. PCC 73106 TaxID=102232 RepID=UPI0002AB9A27|nr:TonB-dependent siderophore receptor [Gloeocapsa sp. PCC 73106]ELR97806.1 TonB-dependent siderophore receptor [Gloeocapsa sp. PCC 73106]
MLKKTLFLLILLGCITDVPVLAQSNVDKSSQLLVQGTPTPITGVKLDSTPEGLSITLETPSRSANLQPLIFSQEDILIIDILDAVLTLAEGKEFKAENPSAEIQQITVSQLDDTSIRITVKGKTGIPSAQVVPSTQNLVLSLTPGEAPTAEEEIEVVATQARQEGYLVPRTAIGTGTDTEIMDTPFSVRVIPQRVIREQQAIRVEEVLRNVSGVNFGGTTGGRDVVFSIRGFGSQINSAPVLRDGYRVYGNFQPIPELANLEQIEVLKGPSSILFGQIEPGGIINLVSKKPLSEPFREIELQLGNQGLIRPRFDISGPLNPQGNLLYRLNGLYKHEWSFRDFDRSIERYSYAPVIAWKINDRTDVEFSAEYIKDTGPADFGLSQLGDGVAPVPRERVINNPQDTIDTDYFSIGYSFEHRFNSNWKLRNSFRYLSYNYDYSVVALPFIVDGPNITRFFADQDGQQRSYSLYTNAVGKFATGPVKHELLIGVDLNRSEDGIQTVFGDPSTINIFNPDYDQDPIPDRSTLPIFGDTTNTSERLGFYLQDQISLLSNLILVAGFRYDTISTKINNIQTDFTEGGETLQNDDAFIPRVGLLYRPIPALSVFANYSQSFNPSSETTVTGETLEPERGEGFEVGIKTELFEQRLLATVTYFNITKENVGVTDPNNPLFSAAIGEQKSEGVELDLVGEILPGWNIIASYAYIDAKVTEDPDPSLIDNRLFGVPYNSASLWMTYEIQSGTLQGLGFGAGLNYVGDRFGDLANSYTVGDYLIGNAAIFYNRNRYRFALNFKNIADVYYINAANAGDTGIEPGQPFTVIGSFSLQF